MEREREVEKGYVAFTNKIEIRSFLLITKGTYHEK